MAGFSFQRANQALGDWSQRQLKRDALNPHAGEQLAGALVDNLGGTADLVNGVVNAALAKAGVNYQLPTGQVQKLVPESRGAVGASRFALGMVGPPAAKAAELSNGARAVEEFLAKALPKKPPIIAYHGSPHGFDKFDLGKIGTGEGAQAYGHGLYFAENEGVARGYRDALAGQPTLERSTGFPEIDRELLHTHGGDWEAFKAANPNPDTTRRWQIEDIEADGVPGLKTNGHMYQVGINAEPERFIDWDRKLSEQHPEVQAALGYSGGFDETAGSKLYRTFFNPHFAGDLVGKNMAGADEVSQHLADKGLPGIKYLDRGSRGAAGGTRNYVVFDPKTVDILKRYAVPGLLAGTLGMGAMQQGQQP